MRKKEDLKKLLPGEKNALKADNRITIPFLFFLILPGIIFPQIPLDGFCALNSFKTSVEYQRTAPADLDGDKQDEIILFSPGLKKAGILSWLTNGGFAIKDYDIEFELSQVRFLKDQKIFVCASRKRKLVAVYNFILSSPPELITAISFDSYPENISEADINGDGKPEIVVSGAGFDGLSILYFEENRLAEKKVLSGESLSNAVFTDLTNDGYPDIAAYNIISNSIEFLYNNTRGRFSPERKINITGKIDILNSADVNSDGFQDIFFTKGTDLNILYGDFQSSYKKKKVVPLKYKPDFLKFTSCNNDDFFDIAYLNTAAGTVNILFGRDGSTFFNEITYTIVHSPLHLQTFNINKKKNLIISGADSCISTISFVNNNFSAFDLVPAVDAGFIHKFDWNNDSITDICFIDEADNSLKILLRDIKGIPSVYYQNKLAEAHGKILVDDFYKQRKTFYCYSEDRQLIEALRFNFKTNKGILQQLYSPGKIKDVVVQRADSSLVYIYVLYEKLNKLYIGSFEHREQSVIFKEFPFIDRAVISAGLFLNNGIGTFYWKASSDSVFLNEAKIKNGRHVYRGITGIGKSDSLRISLIKTGPTVSNNSSFISLVNNAVESYLIKFNRYSYSIIRPSDKRSVLNSINGNQFLFDKINSVDKERLFVYNSDQGYLNELKVSNDGKTYSFNRIFKSDDIKSYFIDKFRNGINHLIYANKKKGCISIVPLKK